MKRRRPGKFPAPATVLPVAAALVLTGCEAFFPLQQGSRRTQVETLPVALTSGRCERRKFAGPDEAEANYIRERRASLCIPPCGHTIGVALSGGGVRSANFNLGTLQGLEDSGVLANVDYLSCVSGGGYIGGWYVSHLRTAAEMKQIKAVSPAAALQFSSRRSQLLNIREEKDCAAVDYVRARSGVFGHGLTKTWGITRSLGFLTLTFVPNFLQDLVVHLQPAPGKWNAFHPFLQYQILLRDTYLNGWQDLKGHGPERPILSQDINIPGSQTPYLISCGALGNGSNADEVDGKPAKDPDGGPLGLFSTKHFEFTRYWCGSPDLGWIPTESFDRTVERVEKRADGKNLATVLAGPVPVYHTAPFRLGTAMAASGAALDAVAVGPRWRLPANTALTAFNLNLRYQTANFAQNLTEPWKRPLDRLRETGPDRFVRGMHSNVLQISDGGHFDNLGAYALLRRQVEEIYVFDASQDGKYQYGDLIKLLKRIKGCGWSYEIAADEVNPHDPKNPDADCLPKQLAWSMKRSEAPERPVWTFKVWVRGKACTVHYVKNCYRPEFYCDPTITDGPALYALNPRVDPTVVPKPGEQTGPNKTLTSCCFPHVGTGKITGWDQPMFDAYRELGRYLARRAAKEAKPAVKS